MWRLRGKRKINKGFRRGRGRGRGTWRNEFFGGPRRRWQH